MGFKLGRTYVLEFPEGTYLAGAEVRVRSMSIATIERVEEMSFAEGFPLFLEHVEGWNLEDADGTPLAIDEKACTEVMERPVRDKLVREWYKAAAGISAPLDQPLPDGDSSPTTDIEPPSIPMESLFALPENTSGQSGS